MNVMSAYDALMFGLGLEETYGVEAVPRLPVGWSCVQRRVARRCCRELRSTRDGVRSGAPEWRDARRKSGNTWAWRGETVDITVRSERLLTPKHFVERPVAPGLRVDGPGSAGQLKRPKMDVHVERPLSAQLTRAVTTGKGERPRFAQAGESGRSLYGTWWCSLKIRRIPGSMVCWSEWVVFKAHGELSSSPHMLDLSGSRCRGRWDMRFVWKRMTPPNLSLVSWIGISGGTKTGVDTAPSAMRILGHALDVYEVCRVCFPIFVNCWRSSSFYLGGRWHREVLLPCTERAAVYAGAWLCVLERGARGCATPLAPARGPRCKPQFGLSCICVVINSSWLAVVRHSTFCQDTVQDTMLWLHPCGRTVDRLRRSTVGSGTREDVVNAYEMTVLPEVVYIAPVPAVFAAPACRVAVPTTSHQPLPSSQRLRLWWNTFRQLVQCWRIVFRLARSAACSMLSGPRSGPRTARGACPPAREIASHRIIGRSRVQLCRSAAGGGHRRPAQDRGGVPCQCEVECLIAFGTRSLPAMHRVCSSVASSHQAPSRWPRRRRSGIWCTQPRYIRRLDWRSPMQWPAVWRHGRLDFAHGLQDAGVGCGIHRSPRCPIRPRAWLRDDGLRFRASNGRPFRTWLATSQSGFSVFLLGCNSMAETLERFESLFTSLPRTDDALQSGLSRGVPCRTSLWHFTTVVEGAGTSAIRHILTFVCDELLRWRMSSWGCASNQAVDAISCSSASRRWKTHSVRMRMKSVWGRSRLRRRRLTAELRSRMQGTQIDRVGRTVIGVLGCLAAEVLRMVCGTLGRLLSFSRRSWPPWMASLCTWWTLWLTPRLRSTNVLRLWRYWSLD